MPGGTVFMAMLPGSAASFDNEAPRALAAGRLLPEPSASVDDTTILRARSSAASASREFAPRQLLWLLFAGCWAGYGTTLVVGALPWSSEPGLMLTRVLYLGFTLLCSGPVWIFCRVLWRRGWSWPQALCAMAALCYPLGCICTLGTNWISNTWRAKPEPFSDVLLSALSATSPFCVLVFWGGLYFGFKQYERSARVEALAREAELRALRHQLTPHFLCNTLNGISTLVGEGQTQEARRMIARLGDFLRATLESVGTLEVSLAQEIRYLEQYLAIEQARLGDRLGVEIIADPAALDAGVPNLLLQPLVENAVQHGVAPFPAGGDITIRAQRRAGRIFLSVRNQSREPAALLSPKMHTAGGGGLGLQNTSERLRVAYGAAAGITCSREEENSWLVTIELPWQPFRPAPAPGARGDLSS